MATFSLHWLIIVTVVMTTATQWRTEAQDVNGNWSEWSVFVTPCNQTCGGGYKLVMRSCTNPAPQGNGNNCTKLDNTTGFVEYTSRSCNTQTCFNGTYSDWELCENCTLGYSYRVSLCGNKTCSGNQYSVENKTCNRWNITTCPSSCTNKTCPEYAICRDISNATNPLTECVCTMGYAMNDDGTTCVRPPPILPAPRPIPTLPAIQKVVAIVVSKSASTILIIFVSLTLILFLMLRVFTTHRVIQMNMEIALLIAHLILLFTPPTAYKNPPLCQIISILNHFFFTAAFLFMMLEALHMYSLVSYVVKRDGFLSRLQNTMVGWGISGFIILFCLCFDYAFYGGEYHCWLRMDTPLIGGELLPVLIVVVIAITLIEAAGAMDFEKLKGVDPNQLFSARISQRTNLVIIFFVLAHWLVGMLSEYEQSLALYGIFSILNSISGGLIFFLHCSCSEEVRGKLSFIFGKCCCKKNPPSIVE